MWRHGCLVAVLTLSITGCAVYERADTTPGESPGVRAVPAHCKAGQPVVLKTQPLSPYVLEGGDGYAYFDVWLQACPAPGAASAHVGRARRGVAAVRRVRSVRRVQLGSCETGEAP